MEAQRGVFQLLQSSVVERFYQDQLCKQLVELWSIGHPIASCIVILKIPVSLLSLIDSVICLQSMRNPHDALNQEVTKLIQKGVIEEVELYKLGFSSPMYMYNYGPQERRPVINLRFANQYVVKPLEDFRNLKDIIQKGDQMDLKDAYFSVLIAQNSKRLF